MLDHRERLVLQTIIDEYIQNREPVGSKNVSRVGPLKMSPATIRSIMVDLEGKGYLLQPHTSSGRVPTDQGYRYYVDHLVAAETVALSVADAVHESLAFESPNVPALMQEFSKRLGELTKHIGFVSVADKDLTKLRRVEFAFINRRTVLAVLISKGGFVQNVLINTELALTNEELTKISNYLNANLKRDSLYGLLTKIQLELNECTSEVLNFVKKVAEAEKDSNLQTVFIQGATNILEFPEFKDAESIRTLLRTVEEKKQIADIIERCMHSKGVQIFVGSETGFDIEELGLVAGSYKQGGNIVGMVGIIGPKRMRYDRIISVVNYSTHIIEKMINQLNGGYDE